MGINTKIVDGGGTNKAVEAHTTKDHGTGLKVYTFDGISKENSSRPYTNPVNGIDMNVNGVSTGTPEQIHNGTDNPYWTGSILSGNPGEYVFDSTNQAQSGTRSIQSTASDNNDQAMFTRASVIDLDGYLTLTGGIYIVAWPTSGSDKDYRFYWRDGGSTTGVEVQLKNYINTGLFNQWQNFTIPLADFQVTDNTVDELVMRTVDISGGSAPDVYFDNLRLQEDAPGNDIVYSIAPSPGELWEVMNLTWIFADNITGTVSDGTMPGLAYDKILGVNGLSNGITIRRIQDGEIKFSAVVRDLLEIIGLAAPTQFISGSDGTNSWIRITKEFPGTFILNGDTQDSIEISINDDLSGLLRYRMTSNIRIITETNGD